MSSSTLHSPAPAPMCPVIPLHLQEQAGADQDTLTRLMVERGEFEAQSLLMQALDVISSSLTEAARCWRRSALDELPEHVQRLREACVTVGLLKAARVARDVEEVIHTHDHAALGATLGRLTRLVESGLSDFWAA